MDRYAYLSLEKERERERERVLKASIGILPPPPLFFPLLPKCRRRQNKQAKKRLSSSSSVSLQRDGDGGEEGEVLQSRARLIIVHCSARFASQFAICMFKSIYVSVDRSPHRIHSALFPSLPPPQSVGFHPDRRPSEQSHMLCVWVGGCIYYMRVHFSTTTTTATASSLFLCQ